MRLAIKKWVVRPFIIITISIVVLVAVAFIVLSTQQERLVNLAVDQLNQQFKGELSIEKSSIALFKNFPDVSVALHNGRFYPDKSKKGKPIGQFEVLYVGFSVPELLKQNYSIEKLFLKGGYLDLVQQQDGSINLLERANNPVDSITVAESEIDATASVSLHLQKIVIQKMKVSFLDKVSGQKFSSQIDKLTSSIKIDTSQLAFVVTSDMKLDFTSKVDTVLFRDKKFHIDIVSAYKLNSEVIEISSCKFKIQDAGFNVTGFASLKDSTAVNFRVKGDKQDFKLFSAFVPTDLKKKLKSFKYDGRLYFDALIKGYITQERQPLIQVSFGCEEGWFLNTSANKKIDQLGFKGYYTNGSDQSLKTSEIHITKVSARPEKGFFKGDFVIRDFTKPQAIVKINSQLELKFLGEFLGIPDLKQMTGTVKLDMNFKEIHDIKLPEESLNKLKEGIQSKLVVTNLSFQIPGYKHAVQDMNLQAEMEDGKVTIDSAYLKIGDSDLELSGSISDVRTFLRERDKTIKLALNVKSKQLMLSNLLSYDTALARKWNEEVHGFNINLSLETTVQELLHPAPLPKGTFEMKNLRGSFKNYAHTIKNLGATVIITDTLLRLRDFTGMIDSSDFNFKGRVSHYRLWFDDIKKGKPQVAFDFKSDRFALRDIFTKDIRSYLPRGYRREQLNNVWLRAKVDLRYDTIFRFAKAKVTNVSAELKNHKLKLREISGGVKYGSKILSFDTLRGKIGNSDFDINLKYYFKGVDRYNNAIANSLTFKSKFLDADEMSQYDLAPKAEKVKKDTISNVVAVAAVRDTTSVHAQAFNIFMIPFSDFNAKIDIARLKYNGLWLRDVNLKATMLKDQTISVDTLAMKVAGGAIALRGKFDGSNHEKIFFKSTIKFTQVDLEKIFLKLDHLGQDIVVNKNIKGRLNGLLISTVRVHPDLMPIMNSTRALMNLRIFNGSLVDFAPMQAMAGYFKDKNLRLIRFDTLQNRLRFTNGVLDIPEMDINSSLGYIQVSGKQSIDLSMEYYLRVPMKMVTNVGMSSLFKKKPEEVDMSQVDEIEYVDKDKKIAFMNLKVTGTPNGKYEVGLGKQPRKKRMF